MVNLKQNLLTICIPFSNLSLFVLSILCGKYSIKYATMYCTLDKVLQLPLILLMACFKLYLKSTVSNEIMLTTSANNRNFSFYLSQKGNDDVISGGTDSGSNKKKETTESQLKP